MPWAVTILCVAGASAAAGAIIAGAAPPRTAPPHGVSVTIAQANRTVTASR